MNPFELSSEDSVLSLGGWQEEERILQQELQSHNVWFFAPRGYGKTLFVQRFLRRLALPSHGVCGLYIDLTKTPTVEAFCRAYEASVRRIFPNSDGFLTGVDSLGVEERTFPNVINLPERLAEEREIRLVVALGEFQEISRILVRPSYLRIFGDCIRAHRHVRYIFFGSIKKSLEDMFKEGGQFHDVVSSSFMKFERPSLAYCRAFLRSQFRAEGIIIQDAEVEDIVKLSRCEPRCLMELASGVFEHVATNRSTGVYSDDVKRTENEIVARKSDLYDTWLETFSTSKCLLVRALARKPTARFDSDYRKEHGLPGLSTLHTALLELVQDRIVKDKSDEEPFYSLVDPFLEHYLKQPPAQVFSKT